MSPSIAASRPAVAVVAGAVAGVAAALVGGAPARSAVVDAALLLGAIAGGVVGWRRPGALPGLVALAVALSAWPMSAAGGRGAVAFIAVLVAVAAGLWVHRQPLTAPVVASPIRRHVGPAVVLGTAALIVYSVYAVERHRRFGSGSWDYGCYVHNAWLFASGEAFSLAARSSVLGDVAFWGGTNHFMPSLVFTAPVAWLMQATGDTSWLAVTQNVVLTATAVPLALLARRRGLGPLTSTAIVAAFLVHPGTQAALLFDVHEIAPVPLLLVTSALLIEDAPTPQRAILLAVLLALCAGTKESSWLYVMGFGAFMVASSPGWRRAGVVVGGAALIGFVVVVGVLQPALLEDGATMIHAARFRGVADAPAAGLFDAGLSMLRHPGRAVAALVTPTEKLTTLFAATAGFGHAPLLSLPGLLLGAPNLVERFLSDKREMWGLAFHYGLVTVGWLAVAAVDALGRLRRHVGDVTLATIVTAGLLVTLSTSPRAPDLASLEQPYFASAVDVDRYTRALSHITADDAVVAQNHFLPHVALRRHIWQPEARFIERADVVILDASSSPWPHDRRHVLRLIAALDVDPRFRVVFREGPTVVFRRHPPG